MNRRGIAELITGIMGVIIFTVIALAVVPTVANVTSQTTNNTAGFTGANVTGATNSLAGLFPLLFVALVIVGMVRFFGVG